MQPLDPRHRENHRDDEHRDFAQLKNAGQVRSEHGGIISVNKRHNKWSPLQRDQLYQAYCDLVKAGRSDEFISGWIDAEVAKLKMSKSRAVEIIDQGNGKYPGENMQWRRGLSV